MVAMLVAKGYEGSRADAGLAVGRVGDGGIDGATKEDNLGLDIICIQAKGWRAAIGVDPVRSFVGASEGGRARKG